MLFQIVNNIKDALVLIVFFGFTIFVHELGHFLAALWCGMVVDTFSIGFGPALWKKKIRGIVYKIGAIPFGGYVAIPQLDPTGMSMVQGDSEKSGEEGKTESAPVLPPVSLGKKIFVSVAGAIGNILFALILAWAIYFVPDNVTRQNDTFVGFVDPASLAYERGLRVGDRIMTVNGRPVQTWYDFNVESILGARQDQDLVLSVESEGGIRELGIPSGGADKNVQLIEGIGPATDCLIREVNRGSPADQSGLQPGDIVREVDGVRVVSHGHFVELISGHPDEEITFLLQRRNKTMELKVTPRFDATAGRALIGAIVTDYDVMPWMQHRNPWAQVRSDATQIVRFLKALVTPKEARQAARGLSGPPMIFVFLWLSIKVSFINAVGFVRFLNVNLAILNLLPIPVLDGGHIAIALFEGISRRKANPKVINVLINIFAALLIGVFLFISIRDIPRVMKLFSRKAPAPEAAAPAEVVQPEAAP